MSIGPMRRGALARQQSSAAEQEGAGADARDPVCAGGLPRDEINSCGIAQRLGNAMPAGYAQDIGLRTAREIVGRQDRKTAGRAPGIRQSACAGAVKSSWVIPGNSRKTIVVAAGIGGASVIRMSLRWLWITQARGSSWLICQPRFPMGLHLQRQSRGGPSLTPRRAEGKALFIRVLVRAACCLSTGGGGSVAAFEHFGGIVERLGLVDRYPARAGFVIGAAAPRGQRKGCRCQDCRKSTALHRRLSHEKGLHS